MAAVPIPLRGVKPPRVYPNWNGLLGIRAQTAYGAGQSGIAAFGINKPVPIGTVPAGSNLLSCRVIVTTPLGAGYTVDVGTDQDGASLAAGVSASAAGNTLSPDASAGLGYSTNERIIFVTVKGSGAPAAGRIDVLTQHYSNVD